MRIQRGLVAVLFFVCLLLSIGEAIAQSKTDDDGSLLLYREKKSGWLKSRPKNIKVLPPSAWIQNREYRSKARDYAGSSDRAKLAKRELDEKLPPLPNLLEDGSQAIRVKFFDDFNVDFEEGLVKNLCVGSSTSRLLAANVSKGLWVSWAEPDDSAAFERWRSAEHNLKRELPNPFTEFNYVVPEGESTWAFINMFNELPCVESASPIPQIGEVRSGMSGESVSEKTSTTQIASEKTQSGEANQQTIQTESGTGMPWLDYFNAPQMWETRGSTGRFVDFVIQGDGPFELTSDHPTITLLNTPVKPGGTFESAHFLMAGAKNDGQGLTGITYNSSFYLTTGSYLSCNATGCARVFDPALAISKAIDSLGNDAIIVIPQVLETGIMDPYGKWKKCQLPWSIDRAVYFLLQAQATKNPIPTVIMASGNYQQNLANNLLVCTGKTDNGDCVQPYNASPLIHDAPYLLVGGGSYSNFYDGRINYFINTTGYLSDYGAVVIGGAAALVQSAWLSQGVSSIGHPGNTARGYDTFRYLNLLDPIGSSSALLNPSARLRIQTPLPEARILQLGGAETVPVGRTEINHSLPAQLPIFNDGKQPLTLSGYQFNVENPDHSAFKWTETPPSSIPAGGNAVLKFEVITAVAGDYKANLLFNTNDSAANLYPVKLRFAATVAQHAGPAIEIRDIDNNTLPYTVGGYGVDFGVGLQNSFTKDESTRYLEIRNVGTADLNVNIDLRDAANWGWQKEGSWPEYPTIPPEQSRGIILKLKYSNDGSHVTDCYIRSNDPLLSSFPLKLQGKVIKQIDLHILDAKGNRYDLEEFMSLGAVNAEDHARLWLEKGFSIISTAALTLKFVNKVTSPGDDFLDLLSGEDPIKLEPDKPVEFRIVPQAGGTKAGYYQTQFWVSGEYGPGLSFIAHSPTFRSRAFKNGPNALAVAANPDTPKALQPCSSVPIGSDCDFGSTKINSPLTRTFELRNSGSQTLYLTNWGDTGGGFIADFKDLSIPPGGKGYLDVTLKALTVGSFRTGIYFHADTNPPTNSSDDFFTFDVVGTVCDGADCGPPPPGGAVCGNNTCESGEATTCPSDCSGGGGPPPTNVYVGQGSSINSLKQIPWDSNYDLYVQHPGTFGSIGFLFVNGTTERVRLWHIFVNNYAYKFAGDLFLSNASFYIIEPGQSTNFGIYRKQIAAPRRYQSNIDFDYQAVDNVGHPIGSVIHKSIQISDGPLQTTPPSDISASILDVNGTPLPFGPSSPDGSVTPVSDVWDFGTVTTYGYTEHTLSIKNTSATDRIVVFPPWAPRSGQVYLPDSNPTQSSVLDPGGTIQYTVRFWEDGSNTGTGTLFGAYKKEEASLEQSSVFYIPIKATPQSGAFAQVFRSTQDNNIFIDRNSKWNYETKVGQSSSWLLKIQNWGDQDLLVSNLHAVGEGFAIIPSTTPTSFRIAHNQIVSFRVRTYATTAKEYIGTVSFDTNDLYQKYSFELHATGTTAGSKIRVNQGSEVLSNGGTFDPTSPTTFNVCNDGTAPMYVSSVNPPTGYMLVRSLPFTIDTASCAGFEIKRMDGEGNASLGEPLWFKTDVEGEEVFELFPNSKPVAVDDSVAVSPGQSVSVGVTVNDFDPDGESVALILDPIVTPPLYGTVSRASDSTLIYTAGSQNNLTDSFEYEIGDGEGRRGRAWVTVKIGNNTKPVAVDDAKSIPVDTQTVINVTMNDYDPDGDAPMLISSPIVTDPVHGSAVKVSSTEIVYTPAEGFSGIDSFQYEIGDGRGERARAWVKITIGNTNHKPVAVNDSASTGPDTAVAIDVTRNDYDPDNDLLELILQPVVIAPEHGSVIRLSGSNLQYVPVSGYTGTDSFMYEIGDGHGSRARATVNVLVSSTNTEPVAASDQARTAVNTPVVISVINNDTDADGDQLWLIRNPVITAPQHGNATKISGTVISYAPQSNYAGTDTFQYEIGDGRGGRSRAWVSIIVGGAGNQAPVAVNDSITVTAGESVDINVITNDTDADGDTLVLSSTPITTLPSHGTALKSTDTSIHYTAESGYSGSDSFVYEISDPFGLSARGTVQVTIAASPNGKPVANDDLASTRANNSITIDLLTNDTSGNGSAIVLTADPIVTRARRGDVVRVSDRVVTYTPALAFAGSDTFEYEIVDGQGNLARAWVDVSVLAGENPPQPQNDLATSTGGNPVVVDVMANDASAYGQLFFGYPAVSYQPAHGTAYTSSTTSFTYTPQPGFTGTDSFRYDVVDAYGGSGRAWVTITVTDNNRMPVAATDSAAVVSNNTITINVVANDSDPDGDAIVLRDLVTLPHGGTAVLSSESAVSYTASPGFAGTDSFEYEIVDARGGIAWGTVIITVKRNDPPQAVSDFASTNIGKPVEIDVVSNDTDGDNDQLALSSNAIYRQPGHGTATAIGSRSIRYTPNAGFAGSDGFQYQVEDTNGGLSIGYVGLTIVNRLPVAMYDNGSTFINTAVSINVLSNDTDPDGDPILLSTAPIVLAPANGSAVRASDTTITYTPNAGFVGTDQYEYQMEDSHGGTGRAVVTVVISNRPPIATNDSASAISPAAVSIPVTANDSDPDGDPISLTTNFIVTPPAHGDLIKESATTVSYRPLNGFTGSDSFQYQVSDNHDGVAQAWVYVNVIANKAPVAGNDSASTNIGVPVTINVTANDTDADGDAVTLIQNPISTQPSHGTAVRFSDTSIKYTPTTGYAGSDSFVYVIQDGRGGSANGTVSISVNNRVPAANSDTATTTTPTAVTINVVANDTDPDGDTLVLSANWLAAQPAHGSLAKVSGTSISYTPIGTWSGSDSFQYEITDGRGATAIGTVNVTVKQNPPPTAVNDSASTISPSAVSINVVANDSDPDGDPLSLGTNYIVTAPVHGDLTQVSSTTISYKPLNGYSGSDSFQYRVSDNHGATEQAWVYITVIANKLPLAVNDSASTYIGTAVTINVTSNDSDPDGDTVTLLQSPIGTQPSHGSCIRMSNTTITYTPSAGYAGTDSFTYIIQDGRGGTATGTVSISINNRAPVANNDSATTITPTAVTINVVANDTDADGDVVSLSANWLAVQPVHGSLTKTSSTSITYTPIGTWTGTDSFQYEITDGRGTTAKATVSVIVKPNSAPTAVNDTASTVQPYGVNIVVTSNDSDADGDSVKLSDSWIVTYPAHADVIKVSDTTILYKPFSNWSGTDTFQYEVTDGRGATARAWVTVTVTK